jgi:hypothetical protein
MSTNFDDTPPTVDSFARPAAGNPLNSPDQATLVNNHSDAIEAIETALATYSIYAPTPAGNGLSVVTSTWAGLYKRVGDQGTLHLSGEVKGNWAGSGYVSIPLPSGWTAAAIDSVGSLYGFPMPSLGAHWTGQSLVHAGATEVRLVAGTWAWVDAGVGPGFCTATASTDAFACGTAHGLGAGDRVTFSAANSTSVPAGTVIGTTYFVISSGLTSTAFKVSTTSGGSTINVTADGNVWATKLTQVRGINDVALDGVNSPPTGPLTGDGTSPNDDLLFATIVVELT